MVGNGKYSMNEITQPYTDTTTKQINISDLTLYADPISLFEVKNINTDLSVRVKN